MRSIQELEMKHITTLHLSMFLLLVFCNCDVKIPEDFVLEPHLEWVLKEFVKRDSKIIGKPLKGEYFCAFHVFGIKKFPHKFVVYLYIYCDEYYLDKGKLQSRGECVRNAAVTLKKKMDSYEVIGCEIPGHGSEYGKHVRNIFPKNVADKILNSNDKRWRIKKLRAAVNEKAMEFYFE